MALVPENVLIESGLSLEFVLKEIKLNEVLSQWPLLCAKNNVQYALFGGTAINKAFLDQPRFSEDADFFVYGKTLKQADSLVRQLIGFKVNGPHTLFRDLHRWTLEYVPDDYPQIRGRLYLDLNLSFKKPKTASETRKLTSFLSRFGFAFYPPTADVLPAATLVATKLLALQNRQEGKDYYDLYQLLSKQSFSKTLVLAEAHKYSNSLFDFTKFNENLLDAVSDGVEKTSEKMLSSYDAFILKSSRPDWGALKKDLVRLIKTRIR